MSTEHLCNVSPEVDDTSEEHEECAPVPTANDFGIVFVGGALSLVFELYIAASLTVSILHFTLNVLSFFVK
jgi:hypothetical protein